MVKLPLKLHVTLSRGILLPSCDRYVSISIYLSVYVNMFLSIGIVLAVQVLLRYLMDTSLGICLEETQSHIRRLPVGSVQFFNCDS